MKENLQNIQEQELFPSSIINNLLYKLFMKKVLCSFIVTLVLFLSVGLSTSYASHFRYGNISWRTVPGTNGKTIEFKVSQAWRYTAFYPSPGGTTYTDYLYFGDGSFELINLAVNQYQ